MVSEFVSALIFRELSQPEKYSNDLSQCQIYKPAAHINAKLVNGLAVGLFYESEEI